MSRKQGAVKVKLSTGRTVYVDFPGQLPQILILEAGPTEDEVSRVPCIRIDLEEYRQMTVPEMIESGLIKVQPRDGDGETKEGGAESEGAPAPTDE